MLVRLEGSEVPATNIMPTQAGVSQRMQELLCAEHCADILMVTVYVLTFANRQLLVFLFVALERKTSGQRTKQDMKYAVCSNK
jgi:hypothetical protein